MFKISYSVLLILFSACLFNKFCLSIDRCGIYRNTKFEWWGTDCGRFCHQANTKVTCKWFQNHQGCFCNEGYFRDRNWDCVPLQGCDSHSIQLISSRISANKSMSITASSGSASFKFNSDFKILRPVVSHSAECPPNEVHKKCGENCMNLCESKNNPEKCKNEKCSEGCFCKEGMLRNYNGACIPEGQCQAMMISGQTKYRFSFSMSISLSLYMKQNYKGQGWSLTAKDKLHKCTSPNCKAEPKCKPNEMFTTCGDSCAEHCKNIFLTENCAITCETGCYCKLDYHRNKKGVCVPAKMCPLYNKNRKLSTTTPKRIIQQIQQNIIIPPFRPTPSYRSTTTTQKQVIEKVDSKQCPENERFGHCDSHCQEMCENAQIGMRTKTRFGKCSPNMACLEGCFCKDGYFRDLTDACVPRNKCPPPPTTPKPPIKCKINEMYTTCGSKCSESCDVFKNASNANCPPTCDKGCFCIQGFYRDKFGMCVPQDQCECELEPEKCKDPKEEYLVCGKNCRETCDIKSPECEEACSRGCFCKSGFVYNENGVCISPNQCGQDIRNGTKAGNRKIVKPGPKCTKDNEKWSNCANLCTEFCEGVTSIDEKKCSMTCVATCVCKKGYRRNAADECVKIERCGDKPKCKENESYHDHGTHCYSKCKDVGHDIKCPLEAKLKGCFCNTGFLRDENGKCIPKSKCRRDLTPDCPANEVYNNCSTRCGESCEDKRNPVPCPEECEPGCYCSEGYFRDAEGICGPLVDCNIPPVRPEDKFCKDKNEVYKDCGNKCEETCEFNQKCKKKCENGCFCIIDYLRNRKGQCVPMDECMGPPQCAVCKPNEYYTSCGTDCGRMCTDINKKNSCDKSTPCHQGCLCKWGFFRTKEGNCVTKNECQVMNEEDDRETEYITTEDSEDDTEDKPGVIARTQKKKKKETRRKKKSKNGRSLGKPSGRSSLPDQVIPYSSRDFMDGPLHRSFKPIRRSINKSKTKARNYNKKGRRFHTPKKRRLPKQRRTVANGRRIILGPAERGRPKPRSARRRRTGKKRRIPKPRRKIYNSEEI